MRQIFYFFIAFLVTTGYTQAQSAQDDQLEINLLNAQYDEVIKKVNRINMAKAPWLENKKAEALIRAGKFNSAESLLDSILSSVSKSNNVLDRVITEMNQGFLYLMQGRNDRSIETLQNATAKFDNNNSLEASKALTYLGLAYLNTGRITQAEEQIQAALRVRNNYLSERGSKAPKEFEELIAASYNDLGFVYSYVDKDQALEYYEKALSLYTKLHGNDHPKIAIAKTNIGSVYRDLELYGDAINNFESCLAIWEKAQDELKKAFVVFNLGQTYMKMHDTRAARIFYERALKIFEEKHGTRHPDVARIYNAIGNLDADNRKYDDALQHFQNALRANVTDFNSNAISTNPVLKNFYDGNVLLYSLLYKVQTLEERYFGKTLKLKDLELALRTLQSCDSLIDKLRQQINNENDKLVLGAIASEVYADGVRIAYETAQAAFAKKPFLEQAFYFAEKSKSAVLLDAISEANAKSYAGIPQELLEEEKTLKSAIALCNQKLAQKPTAEEEKYLRQTSFELNRSYGSFIKKLETQFPSYYNLKFNPSSPSIHQLQQKLDPETLLLSYFIDEKNNKLYVFQITKNKSSVTDVTLPSDFNKYITGLRNSLFFNEFQTYIRAANKLSKLLVPAKIPSGIQNLVVLPTGRLSIIPFETLFLKTATRVSEYQELPYLIKRFSVRYEFSTGLILQKAKKVMQASPSIFLCAPIAFPEKDALAELPGTEKEVGDISVLFGNRNFKSSAFTRNAAHEKFIKSGTLKDYTYLHFATHGVVDESNPELSRIFLQSEDAEDGHLFTGEIYNLELNANLVTLSACQTGLGKISKSEGVIGLSRALVYAGAQRCIVSFWSVADESTATLMKEFYRRMLENQDGSNLSTNLKEAKLNLMKQPVYAAPFYWAPFILIGF